MASVKRQSPEDLFIAVLNRVDPDITIVDDHRLVQILDKAAKGNNSPFSAFRAHPVYGDSKVLSQVLEVLDDGGTVHHFGADLYKYKPSLRATGGYGRKKYDALTEAQRKAVDSVAKKISTEFKRA